MIFSLVAPEGLIPGFMRVAEAVLNLSVLEGGHHVHETLLQGLLHLGCYEGNICCEQWLRVSMLYLLGWGLFFDSRGTIPDPGRWFGPWGTGERWRVLGPISCGAKVKVPF